MRKKILFQIAAIIAAFMIVMLVIIEAAISHNSTQLFIKAKEELLSRDLAAIHTDLLINNCVPELVDYCREHMDEVSTDVKEDPAFLKAVARFAEKYNMEKYKDLNPLDFPTFPPEDQAVYAHLWYYFLTDSMDVVQKYYGFSAVAIIDISKDHRGEVLSSGTAERGLDRETLTGIIADEEKRNGTLRKIANGEETEATFGITYSEKKGDWLVGYYPVGSKTESPSCALCILTDLKQFNKSLADQLTSILAFSFAVIAVFAALLIWFLNRKTVQPVTRIQQSVRRYTDDKDTGMIVADMKKNRPGNEIGILAGDISRLAEEMERYNRENISLVAKQERMAAEMNLARSIQNAALPGSFPAFPNRGEFDLYASMTPAREVGGDFYDFFLIDDDHLALVIADVSGKGVPAALFMMIIKTLIQDQLQNGCDPAAALEYVNRQLSNRNPSMMFVTVWLAVVEISTGKGLACNAGHGNPVIRHAGGRFELLKYPHNVVVGGLKKARYQNREFELCPGDCVFVYTDGVTEAVNTALKMFGEERMTETLNQCPDAEPETLIRSVHEAVDRFAEGAEQFDDITMLCFRYNGAQDQGRDPG